MLSTIARSVMTVLLPAGLALLICAQTAQAQRRAGFAPRRQAPGQNGATPGTTGQMGMMCQNGQTGTGSGTGSGTSSGTTTTQTTTAAQAAALQRQLLAQQNALQAQAQYYAAQSQAQAIQQRRALARQNAVLQVAYELQLLGYPPDLALQTAARQARSGR